MSRVGLSKRLHAIRSAIKAHDPRAYALHHLSPQLRRYYDSWRRECALIASERCGNRYKAMLDGQDVTPPMPLPVAAALNIESATGIPASATVDDAAEMYRKCLTGEP